MPRSASVNRQIRKVTTEKILEAAEGVFARKGMAAKMSDVASAAGISQGLAYHYFPSKEAIFLALVRQLDQPADELRATVRKIPGTPLVRLAHIISAMIERRKRFPEFYQFMSRALEEESLPNELRERLDNVSVLVREIVRDLIVQGQATGEIAPDDPDKLTRALLACIDGLSRRTGRSSPDGSESATPDANIIVRMLRPDL